MLSRLAFLVSALLLAPLAPALAQAPAYETTPLMVVRFNQPMVRYERPLATAITRAMQAKPDVRFTLISIAPAYGDKNVQAQLAERADALAGQIREQIVGLGVPSDRVEITKRSSAALTFSEVHILAR